MIPRTSSEETNVILGIPVLGQKPLYMTLKAVLGDDRVRQVHSPLETEPIRDFLVDSLDAFHPNRVKHLPLYSRLGIRDIRMDKLFSAHYVDLLIFN